MPSTTPGSTPGGGPRWLTRGQPTALAAVARMVVGQAPHALLLVGPPSVGKTTLAEDLAAGLLCAADDTRDRPCRTCRACRLLAAGNHPDLHRVVPEGPGGQVVIGDPDDPKQPRGVRGLLHELAYLPVEGGARVAIIERASRMNEDAQNALLKTLEEPPAGVTIVLCADEPELLLPTVRSRCARLRLGPTGPRVIEAVLGERGLADPATAGRLARLAEGRPGIAVAYARAPEAMAIREEIARTLLDLLGATRARRLSVGRELLVRGRELAEALAGPAPAVEPPPRGRRGSAGRGASVAGPPAAEAGAGEGPGSVAADPAAEPSDEATLGGDARKLAPAERRRAARQLLHIWRDVTRDLTLVGLGGRRELRDPALLEELELAAAPLPDGALAVFLVRLDRVAELVAGNANPELALDVLVLAWPASHRAVA
jgi:DNA polymerase III delta' subunit